MNTGSQPVRPLNIRKFVIGRGEWSQGLLGKRLISVHLQYFVD